MMAEDNLRSVIEALLFSSERPLPTEKIKEVMQGLGDAEIRQAIEELTLEYQKTNRGIRIVEIAGGFQMVTSPDFSSFLKKLYKERPAEKLSHQALETLAIVAYKQPVTRREIESLRSVNIDGMIRTLLDKDLIRISGRKKAPGRPHVFGTTRRFLEHFGLKSLEELPKIEDFQEALATRGETDESKESPSTN